MKTQPANRWAVQVVSKRTSQGPMLAAEDLQVRFFKLEQTALRQTVYWWQEIIKQTRTGEEDKRPWKCFEMERAGHRGRGHGCAGEVLVRLWLSLRCEVNQGEPRWIKSPIKLEERGNQTQHHIEYLFIHLREIRRNTKSTNSTTCLPGSAPSLRARLPTNWFLKMLPRVLLVFGHFGTYPTTQDQAKEHADVHLVRPLPSSAPSKTVFVGINFWRTIKKKGAGPQRGTEFQEYCWHANVNVSLWKRGGRILKLRKTWASCFGGLVGAITSLHMWAHLMLQHERFSCVSTNMHVWLHIGFPATSYLYRLGWGCLGARCLG